jgi:hypothetical protein
MMFNNHWLSQRYGEDHRQHHRACKVHDISLKIQSNKGNKTGLPNDRERQFRVIGPTCPGGRRNRHDHVLGRSQGQAFGEQLENRFLPPDLRVKCVCVDEYFQLNIRFSLNDGKNVRALRQAPLRARFGLNTRT